MPPPLLQPIGAGTLRWIRYGTDLFWFFSHAVAAMLWSNEGNRVTRRTTLYQVYFTGVDGVWVVSTLALLLGTAVVVQTLGFLTSGPNLVGTLMDLLIVQQLAPMMTAFIVIGRSGSSITVELGNMRVNGELDLLRALGVDPVHYLVIPRMVGVTYAVLCLCVIFDVVSMLGGYAVSRLVLDVPAGAFLSLVFSRLSVIGLVLGLVKSSLFGIVIATISTWQGLNVAPTITDVPQATRRSVVHSIVACVAINALLTVVVRAL